MKQQQIHVLSLDLYGIVFIRTLTPVVLSAILGLAKPGVVNYNWSTSIQLNS